MKEIIYTDRCALYRGRLVGEMLDYEELLYNINNIAEELDNPKHHTYTISVPKEKEMAIQLHLGLLGIKWQKASFGSIRRLYYHI